jgi:hypothetical protein
MEIHGPGFINIRLKPSQQQTGRSILAQGKPTATRMYAYH